MSTRKVTMYPRQAAARPPHYLLPPPSRRQPEAPAPSRNRQNWPDTIDKQGSKGTPHRRAPRLRRPRPPPEWFQASWKVLRKKMLALCPRPRPNALPGPVGPGRTWGGAGQNYFPSLPPFFGLVFLLISGAGLGAWVGVTWCSRCRVRLAILAGLSLLLFRVWVGRPAFS